MFNTKEHMNLYKKVLDVENFMHLYKKTIFITGATGFIGLWILRTIEYLNKTLNLNIKVIVLLRSKKKKQTLEQFKNTKIEYISGNIKSFSFKKRKIDHIIHLAAETSKKKNKDHMEVINTIINGTIRLIKYSNLVKASSISYLSSGGVYGKNCDSISGWNENDISSPTIYDEVATYGLSKKCAENILIQSFKKLNNLKALNIFRAFSFGGSYFNYDNHFAFDDFIKKRIQQKNISIINNGKSLRNYMHPLDLSCWVLLSKKFSKVNLLNTGAEENYSIRNLAKKIAEISYRDIPSVKVITGNKIFTENYIPNLRTSKKLGLKAKISLDMQIKDSLNYYYGKKNKCIKSSSL